MKARRSRGSPTHANRGEREAERLRRHNEEFRFALEHNITIIEARRKLAQLHFAEFEARVRPPLKPGCAALCGTESPALHDSAPDHPRYWWKDERL